MTNSYTLSHRAFAAVAIISVLVGMTCINLWRDMNMNKMKKMNMKTVTNPVAQTWLKSKEDPRRKLIESTPRRCLSFDESMDELIQKSKEVFLVMLPKAAGTTAGEFTVQCMEEAGIPARHGNFLNNKKDVEEMFLKHVKLPTIFASHLYKEDETLLDLIKQTTRDSLIIFMHREETDRVVSSIKMIVEDWLCGGRANRKPNSAKKLNALDIDYKVNGNTCTMSEKDLIPLIKNRMMEISNGVGQVLTCDVYDAIEEHAPNLVFMDYRQINKLQSALAKHHCPGLLPKLPFHTNVSSEKETKDIRIKLKNEDRSVPFSEWLDAKASFIEFSLSMKKEAQCQAKTRVMETDMDSCPDNLLQVSSASFSPYASLLSP